jgi:hypothetical protein
MRISTIVREVIDVAKKYNLQFIEKDRTDNIVSLKLLIDDDLFIQVYGNILKEKLNLALVFKNRRLYGYDSEGGKYHCHPLDNPDRHIFERNVITQLRRCRGQRSGLIILNAEPLGGA